ncbi:SdpI family protein [Gilvibacter sp.]|uniref:SdpI family protein n=1 Tax=Gilvibacter sp. TaxID=2729997 RepID=UPI0025BE9EC6|nr:SdpI family protein [Gilvibacter sp.]NQX77480.1 SdpI family protein [Gilvibacter sp.]
MNDAIELYVSLSYLGVMIVLAWLFKKYPPKKINSFYGYRTPKSMKTQATWDFANQYSSLLMMQITLYSFVLPFLCYLFFPHLNILITLTGHSLLLLLILVFTERELKARFDQDGKPK